MPCYEYECPIHQVIEVTHSIKEELQECPKCKEENLPAVKPKRLISRSSFVLDGSSWAKEGYS